MKKLILSLALAGAMGFYVNPAMSQASVEPGDGDGGGSCKVELISCNWTGTVKRQVCHENGDGISCSCGASTTCPD